jgi:hypothetical protein
LGWPVVLAFDMHAQSPGTLTPPADPRLAAAGWTLRGYVTGVDAIFRQDAALELGGSRVCYGLLLEAIAAPGAFVVAIRGTADMLEWLEDAEFSTTPHPAGGEAETGFFDLYGTLAYLPVDGAEEPLLAGIARAVDAGMVTVVGHSLGAALATYLTLELAGLVHVGGRFFASPRPGNGAFADVFDKTVADYVAYAWALDAVPHAPLGLGYSPLHNLVEIRPSDSQARIAFGLGAGHHLLCYLAELDYAFQDWHALPPIDQVNAASIKGPA